MRGAEGRMHMYLPKACEGQVYVLPCGGRRLRSREDSVFFRQERFGTAAGPWFDEDDERCRALIQRGGCPFAASAQCPSSALPRVLIARPGPSASIPTRRPAPARPLVHHRNARTGQPAHLPARPPPARSRAKPQGPAHQLPLAPPTSARAKRLLLALILTHGIGRVAGVIRCVRESLCSY
jgi:hypothetical protein